MSGALQAVFADQRSFTAVPGAPTIGTATATGATTATVSFTAPASNGGSPITSYTATSSPGGITGTLSQAGSGTISITGLSGVTSYTFTVTATNAIGTSPSSAASNSITTSRVLGSAFGGGYFAGQMSTSGDSVATHNLVVCDISVGERGSASTWGPTPATTGFTSVINGPANSAGLAALGASYIPATFCEAINTGGYTDWYLPASAELEILFFNLKPTTDSVSTGTGTNAYAVPARASNYTAGNPGRTVATNFIYSGGGQEFAPFSRYWSSTEADDTTAYVKYFDSGSPDNPNKASTNRTRAVRRVAV